MYAFGPGVDLDDLDEGLNQVLPSGSGEGNNQTVEPDENDRLSLPFIVVVMRAKQVDETFAMLGHSRRLRLEQEGGARHVQCRNGTASRG